MKAGQLVNGRPPHRPLFFRETDKEEILSDIERENVESSRNNY
jgi:hypothetical protein